MHVFIESAQRTPTRQAVSATPSAGVLNCFGLCATINLWMRSEVPQMYIFLNVSYYFLCFWTPFKCHKERCDVALMPLFEKAWPSLNAVVIAGVIIDSTVLGIVLHTVHNYFQKCNFWWTHSACLGPFIAAISHTISAHKVSH